MLSARVSHLEQFRIWKDDEDLSMEWLQHRIRGDEEPSDAMKAGTAFHAALEKIGLCQVNSLVIGDYRFDFNCECTIALPKIRETRVERQYGNLLVNGTVDAIIGKEVTDYKTTGQFDPDRYMSGYQWRFYLDMMECDTFCWQVFVIREFGPPGCYEVRDVHTLRQARYPQMHDDCQQLVDEYYSVLRGESIQKVGAIA